MRRTAKGTLVALALLGGPLAAALPAAADVSISVNPGSIAFGYRDGYWDRDHHWHDWRNHDDARWYREHYAQHYYDRRHDRDHDQGWRGSDRWWDRH